MQDNDRLVFRPYTDKDMPQVAQTLSDIWDHKQYSDDPHITALLEEYIAYRYIENANYSLICELDGKVIGGIFAKIDCDDPMIVPDDSHIEELYNQILRTEDGIYYLTEESSIDEIDAKLIEGIDAKNILQLFYMEEKYRLNHIGTRLIKELYKKLRAEKQSSLYLYTDSYCTVNYYLQHGWKVKKSIHTILPTDTEESDFYILNYVGNDNEYLLYTADTQIK